MAQDNNEGFALFFGGLQRETGGGGTGALVLVLRQHGAGRQAQSRNVVDMAAGQQCISDDISGFGGCNNRESVDPGIIGVESVDQIRFVVSWEGGAIDFTNCGYVFRALGASAPRGVLRPALDFTCADRCGSNS